MNKITHSKINQPILMIEADEKIRIPLGKQNLFILCI